jgi:type I restriction enzyme S subunit
MPQSTARLESYLLARYPATSAKSIAVRQYVETICKRFIASGFSDRNFESELCSGSEPRFWQRFTEAALTCDVLDAGLTILPSRNGPDLCIEHGDRKIWVEFICPELNKKRKTEDWLTFENNRCSEFPHEQMLLQWTSAIKKKSQQLLGEKDCDGNPKQKGFLEKGIVSPRDSYVIAVNGKQFRGERNASLYGISQLPFAAEAVFPVGSYQWHFDRETRSLVKTGYQYRPYVKNPNDANVQTDTFLDKSFAAISAVWATDFDDFFIIGSTKELVIVHNPLATNPLPVNLLPAWSEYAVTAVQNDEYRFEKQDGRLALRSSQ